VGAERTLSFETTDLKIQTKTTKAISALGTGATAAVSAHTEPQNPVRKHSPNMLGRAQNVPMPLRFIVYFFVLHFDIIKIHQRW
jgi:hypothetical protein